jgi:hypothetical protein
VSERGGEVESGGRVGLDPTDPGLVWAKSIGPAQQTTWSIFILIFILFLGKSFKHLSKIKKTISRSEYHKITSINKIEKQILKV